MPNRLWAGIVAPMIHRAKLRVKVPGDRAATDNRRDKVLKLVEKHGGKNGTLNPRQHLTHIFADTTPMKAIRTEARAAMHTSCVSATATSAHVSGLILVCLPRPTSR